MWLRLPDGQNFPLYTTVRAMPRLAEFIAGNSIFGDERNLDRSHYLEIVSRDDGTALVLMQYQQIIGSRWLCIVPKSQVSEWVRASVLTEEQKAELYDAGKYVMKVPPVFTGNWDRAAWIAWVDGCHGWRP